MSGAPLLAAALGTFLAGAAPAAAQTPGQPAPAAPAQKPAQAPAPAATDTRDQEFGGWLLTCPPPDARNAACVLVQQLHETLSRRVVFVWALQYDDAKNLVSVLKVPTGIVVKQGLVMKPDPKADGWRIDYTTCNATECQAVAQISGDQMKQLTSSKQTSFAIALDNGQVVNIDIKMDGFVPGITALAARSQSKKP